MFFDQKIGWKVACAAQVFEPKRGFWLATASGTTRFGRVLKAGFDVLKQFFEFVESFVAKDFRSRLGC